VRVAEGFGVNTKTLRRWDKAVTNDGVVALASHRNWSPRDR
jgi:hypothetical protein